jgi:hypothetical protein
MSADSPLVRQSERGPGRHCAARRRNEVRIRDGQREGAGRSYPPLLTSVPQALMIVMRLLQSPERPPRSLPRRPPFDGCARVAGGPERGSGSGGSARAAEANIYASGEGQVSRHGPETSFWTRQEARRALTTLGKVHQKQRHSGPLKRHIRFHLSTGLSIRTSLLPGDVFLRQRVPGVTRTSRAVECVRFRPWRPPSATKTARPAALSRNS